MLIPHDRGSTRNLTLSSWHLWGIVVLLAWLTFTSAFFFERNRVVQAKARELRRINRTLELENAQKPAVVQPVGLREEEEREIEERLRAEYETSIATITAELSDLYDMEAKARDITGLAPRTGKAAEAPAVGGQGKGGPPGSLAAFAYGGIEEVIRPPQVVYGLSRPSADLILQEIRLRTQSLRELVVDMEAQVDRIERVPSIWPLAGGVGQIMSGFGYRRDPFTHRIRLHEGTDISARYGTRVRATAKGVVTSSGYERHYGNIVRISHGNGMQTCYAHLSKRLVKKGDVVKREDVIGVLGSTGRSTGPHLHYEVRMGGKPVDAERYLTD